MDESLYKFIQLFNSGKASADTAEALSVERVSKTWVKSKGDGKKGGCFQKCLMSEAIPGVGDEENRIKLFYQQCLFPAQ